MRNYDCSSHWLATALLILTLTSLSHSQQIDPTNCSNYYSEANLPSECDSTSKTCIFPPISNTTLISNKTDLEEYGLCLDTGEYTIVLMGGNDQLSVAIYVTAFSVIISPGYSLLTSSNVVLLSNNISISGAVMTAPMLWMEAQNIELIDSNITNDGDFGFFCNTASNSTICQGNNYYFPFLYNSMYYISDFNLSLLNYTYNNWIFKDEGVNSVVMVAQQQISVFNSSVQVSVTAIYCTILTAVSSRFNSTGLGYSSGTGPGCGYFDQVLNQLLGCTGTGASHGGYGGNSGPENCNLLVSSPPYDRQFIPKLPGSGGGFFLKQLKQVSSGGGVINVQVSSLILENSVFLANGIGGIQGGGGGSGGSISIDYCIPTITASVNISANGGNAKSSGGGGRVRFFYHNWTSIFLPYQNGINSLLITSYGGSDCDSKLTCGQNGSVIASPCPPGYSLNYISYTCELCSVGSYQLNYGYQKCQLCQNKPQHSFYNTPSETQYSNYSFVCDFTCYNNETTGSTYSPIIVFKQHNGRCLSNFNYVLADVGGINSLICIGIITGTIVIFFVIMMIRKLSFTDRNFYEQGQRTDSFRKRSYFKIEDIPFHEMRIYFDGANTPTNPWQISPHVEQRLLGIEEYSNHLPDLVRLFRALNQIALYPRSVQWLLWLLKIYYYPLGIFLASKMRQKKSKQIRNQLVRRTREKFDVSVGIKMHVNLKYTVGCLQIFNYNKETLDYYIKNYFPIYFKLQKLLIGGYGIDFTDPLFRALCGQFEQKSEKNDRLEDYLIQLNQLLRNSDQTLVIFKHLWKINNVWPSLQCHLWQPDNIILGINDKNQIDKDKALFLVFTTEGKQNQGGNNLALNRSIPQTSAIFSDYSQRIVETKISKHFLYKCNLPNFFFDQITCIRHKYHLREAMIEAEERRTIFWQLDNNFTEKSLSWILGCISIGDLLLTLLSFFLVVFLLVDRQNFLLIAFVPYFVLFPFCQFLMIFLQFSLLISKGARVFSFALYFTLFSAIKMGIVSVIQLVIVILDDFENIILVVLFFVWVFMQICNLVGLLLLSMLHVHYIKTR